MSRIAGSLDTREFLGPHAATLALASAKPAPVRVWGKGELEY